MFYGHHMALTPTVVKINTILKGMTLKSNEHTHKASQLKCQIFCGPDWARLAGCGQLGPTSDSHINFLKS